MAQGGFGGGYNTGNQALAGGGGGGAASGGFFSQQPMASSQQAERSSIQTAQNMVPITIKQWQTAPAPGHDKLFMIDGRQVQTVQLIGQIISVNAQSANTTYTIDDGTGIIPVKQWGEGDASGPKYQQGSYVRVVGRLNTFKENRDINAFKVFAISDFNEITCHFLQVIEAHIHAKNGPMTVQNQAAMQPAAGGGFQGQQYNSNAAAPQQGQQQMGGGAYNASNAPAAGGGDGPDGSENFSPLQRDVLNIIRQQDGNSGNDEGTGLDVVFRSIPQHDQTKIREAVEHLTNEGHLYSTIDEEHFKAT